MLAAVGPHMNHWHWSPQWSTHSWLVCIQSECSVIANCWDKPATISSYSVIPHHWHWRLTRHLMLFLWQHLHHDHHHHNFRVIIVYGPPAQSLKLNNGERLQCRSTQTLLLLKETAFSLWTGVETITLFPRSPVMIVMHLTISCVSHVPAVSMVNGSKMQVLASLALLIYFGTSYLTTLPISLLLQHYLRLLYKTAKLLPCYYDCFSCPHQHKAFKKECE